MADLLRITGQNRRSGQPLDVGFLAAAILVTRLALQGDTRIDALGFICSGLNIVMYGSPLAAMVRITACSSSIFAVTEIFLW